MTKERLRRKRVWSVGDFAFFVDLPHRQARALLHRLNDEMEGKLLIATKGTNRRYRLFPARLAKTHPEIFERVETLEARVDELEDAIAALQAVQNNIATQVGQNTRDVARLRAKKRAA